MQRNEIQPYIPKRSKLLKRESLKHAQKMTAPNVYLYTKALLLFPTETKLVLQTAVIKLWIMELQLKKYIQNNIKLNKMYEWFSLLFIILLFAIGSRYFYGIENPLTNTRNIKKKKLMYMFIHYDLLLGLTTYYFSREIIYL